MVRWEHCWPLSAEAGKQPLRGFPDSTVIAALLEPRRRGSPAGRVSQEVLVQVLAQEQGRGRGRIPRVPGWGEFPHPPFQGFSVVKPCCPHGPATPQAPLCVQKCEHRVRGRAGRGGALQELQVLVSPPSLQELGCHQFYPNALGGDHETRKKKEEL